jgi:hypothetical protein
MLWWSDSFNMILNVAGFAYGIAPASPIHAEPVRPFYPGLRFELKFSEWSAAVGFCGALDFLENVQFRHRHSFLGFFARLSVGGMKNTLFCAGVQEGL